MSYEDTAKMISETGSEVFIPFREDMAEYFKWTLEMKASEGSPIGEERRPTIGIKLDLEDGKTLAIRPGYLPPSRQQYTPDGSPLWRRPGQVLTDRITLELLGPGWRGSKLLTVELGMDGAKPKGKVFCDVSKNRQNWETILKAVHGLLMRPWETFANQADRCCCCHKELTEDVSRSRGIGPECIKWFSWFAVPSEAVKDYRAKYRSIEEPWAASMIG